MKSKTAPTPHLSCISTHEKEHAWPGQAFSLWESELCSWADLPIKNFYIPHQDRCECGSKHFSFILRQGENVCVSLWQRLRRRALSPVQWFCCVPLRGKGIPGQALSGMWALLSPQPVPGCRVRFLMWHRPPACLEDGNGHSEGTETMTIGVNRWKEFPKICKIEQEWLKQRKIRCSSYNEGFCLFKIMYSLCYYKFL